VRKYQVNVDLKQVKWVLLQPSLHPFTKVHDNQHQQCFCNPADQQSEPNTQPLGGDNKAISHVALIEAACSGLLNDTHLPDQILFIIQ